MIQTAFWLFMLMTVLPGAVPVSPSRREPVSPARVLLVENTQSADSITIADYYTRKRRLPATNRLRIACSTAEECSMQEYREKMEEPVRQFLAKGRLRVDYIVLTKGLPIRVSEGGYSTDSLLAAMDLGESKGRLSNPYFDKDERFSHARYRLYLVTRLTGYTRADCLRLVDDALSARPARGPFLLHTGPGHDGPGYRTVNDGMIRADARLQEKGFQSILDLKDTFPGDYRGLMGYFSWGSNDGKFDKAAYRRLRFAPGSLAETAVSTSGRTFENPEAPGQSLIGDLIAQGATGVKGYVSEPYADAIAVADILFDRYTTGYNLAESFYMASRWIHWKDIIIGDPLCAPYAAGRATAK